MKVTIVVCAYNSAKRIGRTLESFARIPQLKSGEAELLLVDNNSTDGTPNLVAAWGRREAVLVRIIMEPRAGQGHARRAGIIAAIGEFLVFLDDDNEPDPEYLAVASAIFASMPDVVFCGGVSRFPSDMKVTKPYVRLYSRAIAVGEQREGGSQLVGRDEFLWGAGLCLRTAAAQALFARGFSPVLVGRVGKQTLSGDDGELTLMLQYFGGRGYYSNDLRLAHRVDQSRLNVGYFLRLFYGMGYIKPALTEYMRAAWARTAGSADYGTERSSSGRWHRRLAAMTPADRVLYLSFGFLFGAAMRLGRLRGRKSDLCHRVLTELRRFDLPEE